MDYPLGMLNVQVASPEISATSATYMVQQLQNRLTGFDSALASNHKVILDLKVSIRTHNSRAGA